MGMLTMARLTPQKLDRWKDIQAVPLASGITAFVGGVIAIASGYGIRGTAATGLRVVGVLGNPNRTLPGPSVTSPNQGYVVDVLVGTFKLNIEPTDPVTIADLQKGVYLVDDNTIAKSPGANGARSYCGVLVDIDDSTSPTGAGAWVTFGQLPTVAPAPTGLYLP